MHRSAPEPKTRSLSGTDWHALDAQRVLELLECDARLGLAEAEAARRLSDHGPNALPEAPPAPWWASLLRQFASPLIYLLFVAAALAAGLGHWGDAGVILVVVVVNALIGHFQEGRAERSMAALRRLSALRVRVLRDGTEQVLEAAQLVPGDLILVAAGDAMAADARLVELAQLQMAEAALTGESVPVAKSVAAVPAAAGLGDRHSMLYSGTHATAGRARAVVVATGADTEVGRIAGLTETAQEPATPLARRLAGFGRVLVAAALALFVLVVLLGLWRGLPLPEILMVAISQMVSMVPEGLPVAMSIALAVGMQRMAARGAVIRRLAAVETLGSTTVICTDKTGTLTRNEMSAVALWLPAFGDQPARTLEVGGIGYAPRGAISELDGEPLDASSDGGLAALLHAAVLCNDATLCAPTSETDVWTVLGDPTEGALLVLAAKGGVEAADLRAAAPRVAELPFDADAKLMATCHAGGAPQVWLKGAPEALLALCAPADAASVSQARAAAESMAQRALRVLAFGAVDDASLEEAAGFAAFTGRVRLLGLVGQIDPPREEVRAAVAECRAAGVRPVMLTGDHALTGLAIARELGIARDGERALDGPQLERLGEAELRAELGRIAVYARVQPAQKLRIVEALQASGEVVAMTGDGVNDAPALARADVGVAMGITGTEVAKGAAKMVITDDNFATLVGAVEQGRVVYGNLKKVILYLFATSMAALLVLFLALLGGFPLPLAAVQILWINIVTEGTVTVNLVMDKPSGDEMRRPPVPRHDPLLGREMLVRIGLMTPMIAATTFGWFAWRLSEDAPVELVRSETFTVLAMCCWFNLLNCRSATRSALRGDIVTNRWLLGGLALSVLLQAAVIYVPALNALFHTVPLPPSSLLPLVALASLVLWAEEARKLVVRLRAAAAQAAVA